MPNLGYLIGSLMAGMAHARRIADEESVAIAEYYRSKPLLRDLSVPRVRVPELTLEVPVILKAQPGAATQQLKSAQGAADAGSAIIRRELAERKISNDSFVKSFDALYRPVTDSCVCNQTDLDDHIKNRLEAGAREAINKTLQNRQLAVIGESLDRERMLNVIPAEIAAAAFEPADCSGAGPIEASILTSDIKDQASPHTVTRLRLLLKEEGLEWNVIEDDMGNKQHRLSPE